MFPELETRNFIYASLTLYVSILFAILHNYANYKNVKNLGSTPVTAVQGLFAKLAQKHKIFVFSTTKGKLPKILLLSKNCAVEFVFCD